MNKQLVCTRTYKVYTSVQVQNYLKVQANYYYTLQDYNWSFYHLTETETVLILNVDTYT